MFAYDAVSYAQYLPYCTVTMSKHVESHPGLSAKFLTKTIFCSDGLMRSFCQNSCWLSRIETVNRDAQTVGGTKGFSLKPTAVGKYHFSAEFRITALLCGMIHYTNSSSYHADVQLSRIIKGDQCWQPLWEHWCMNPMTKGNDNLVLAD